MRPIPRPEFQYGARYAGSGKPSWVYWMGQADFVRELKVAFFETKDIDKALAKVRDMVAGEVRKRV